MTRSVAVLAVAVGLGLIVGARPEAEAQSAERRLDVVAPTPPSRTPELRLEPVMPPEQRGSREQEFYPGQVRSRHEPAFVTPFVTEVPTSSSSRRSSGIRVGFSGWTAPAVPFDIPQATGGVAFGLTILWGVPLSEPAAGTEPVSGR